MPRNVAPDEILANEPLKALAYVASAGVCHYYHLSSKMFWRSGYPGRRYKRGRYHHFVLEHLFDLAGHQRTLLYPLARLSLTSSQADKPSERLSLLLTDNASPCLLNASTPYSPPFSSCMAYSIAPRWMRTRGVTM